MSLAMNHRPAAPPLPNRHPGRRAGNMSTDTKNSGGLDQRNLHIWEHSVTLYHGFDWQAAAENFLFLSRVIERNLESTLCLLNAAIIFARLGEYGTASQILADAEPAGEMMSLTMFVMGHVEFELGNFDKAEDSFKVALNNLKGRSQSYNHLGLEFTLKASHIQQDLRVFASRNNLYGFLGTLGALPADGIFNSPSTSPIGAQPSTLKSRSSAESGYVPTLTDFSTPTSPAVSPVEGYFHNNVWWQGNSVENEVPVLIRHNSISEALEDVRAGFEDLRLSKRPVSPLPLEAQRAYADNDLPQEPVSPLSVASQAELDPVRMFPPQRPGPPPMLSLPATPAASIKSAGRKRLGGFVRKLSTRPSNHVVPQSVPTVDHSRHPALRPRDPQVHGGGTGHLANFILNLPSQNPRRPRDAAGSNESTRDLADFLKSEPTQPAAAPSPAADDASVYSSDEAITDRDLHHLAVNDHSHQEPVSPATRRRLRNGVASLIIQSRDDIRTAPSSIHRSTSTSRSNTPALTALPSVSTRSSSLRISPSNPLPRRLTKGKPQLKFPFAAAEKQPSQPKTAKPGPKMIPAEQPTSFADFFPPFIAKRMSEW